MRVWAVTAGLMALACGCSAPSAVEDSILSFEEETLDSARVLVKTDPAFVDINSTIRVLVDKEALRARLLEEGGSPGVDPDILASLDRNLEALAAAVPRMQVAFDTWQRGSRDEQAKTALLEALEQVGDPTLAIMNTLPRELSSVERRYNDKLERAMINREPWGAAASFSAFQEVASEAVDELRAKEVRRLQEQGIVVRFGAWSSAGGRLTPLHLAGFDELDPGEFVEYERVVVALSDDQRGQWESLVAKAESINQSGTDLDFGSMSDNLVDYLDELLGGPLESLDEEVGAARAETETLADTVKENVHASLARIQARGDLLKLIAKQKVAKYRAIGDNPASLFLLADLRDDARELLKEAQGFARAVLAEKATLELNLTDAAARLEQRAKGIEAGLLALGQVYRSLTSAASLNLATLQFGEEVLALDIADVPEDTRLDLRYTGTRKPGDQVAFVMRGGPKGVDAKQHETLDSREFTLFRILGNISPTVSLAFANPGGTTALKTDFQAAPTYNLLYRWGDRDSAFFNRFFTPGVGLSFSALDFDGDDNLELGVGATAAFFQDWVQVGYGYNVGTDDEYWFFGFSLPLLKAAGGGTQ